MSRLHDRVRDVIRKVLTGPLGVAEDAPELAEALALEKPRDASHGDLTSTAAMRLPKVLRKSPRDIANAIIDEIRKSGDLDDVFESIEPAGPGFINFTFRAGWVAARAARAYADDALGVETVDDPKTVVVDFSAPNAAKPMHIGHIRSTSLGDALCRVLRLLGHKVISDNHLGDWGTQFGMIVYGIRSKGLEEKVATLSVGEIETIYREVSERAERDETTAEAARAEVVKLHTGDPDSRRLWQTVMKNALAELDATYARLGVTFDETLGESTYNDVLPEVVRDLEAKGIARESEGALVVFYEDEKYPPFLVRKRDGAYLYAATDFATVKHRVEKWGAEWLIYVVDGRQQLHFNQLFDACRRWGYDHVRYEHPWFGSILGEDGRPFRTRAGGTVRLSEVLDEAETRALAVVEAKNPEMQDAEKRETARVVGIGALKYADLQQNRTSDYVFSWEKMLSLQGNTAPYMQYMFARVRSIFRKGGAEAEALPGEHPDYRLEAPEELALARGLIEFPGVLDTVAEQLRPNFLSAYLYDLAQRFSAFYDSCPVLKAPDDATRRSRLMLCDHTARVIERGLGLLGIEVVEKM